jgi:hypothetical protein
MMKETLRGWTMGFWILTIGAVIELLIISSQRGVVSEPIVWILVFGLWLFLIRILSAGYPNIAHLLGLFIIPLGFALFLYAQLRLFVGIGSATLLAFLFVIVYVEHYFKFLTLFFSKDPVERMHRAGEFMEQLGKAEFVLTSLIRLHVRYSLGLDIRG